MKPCPIQSGVVASHSIVTPSALRGHCQLQRLRECSAVFDDLRTFVDRRDLGLGLGAPAVAVIRRSTARFRGICSVDWVLGATQGTGSGSKGGSSADASGEAALLFTATGGEFPLEGSLRLDPQRWACINWTASAIDGNSDGRKLAAGYQPVSRSPCVRSIITD